MGSSRQVAKNLTPPNLQAIINIALLVTHQGPTGRLLRRCIRQNIKNLGRAGPMQGLWVITGVWEDYEWKQCRAQ